MIWSAASLAAAAAAQETAPTTGAETLTIERIEGAIAVDGDLSDPAWREVEPITTWYETNPGDNLPPQVPNTAYLAYDDEFFYAAFDFGDPEPDKIRAPLGDRDNVPSYTDYGGVIVDPKNDGQSAQMFLANPRGIQYDAITNDASGEDSSPDFFWESAGRLTPDGWALEMRIPFSSLRYEGSDPEQWRIMLYRNRPREFRYQMFTSRLPRDSNCFICNTRPLVGLAGLPSGSHWVAAPYVFGNQLSQPRAGLGSALETGDPQGEVGADVKWIPNPNTVLDGTVNPDFSQIESDVAQIAANERFALFFPEKRPFFLEGVDLLSTPIQAVYSRTFTAPRWGTRATGQAGSVSYTALIGEDDGGGSVILPGPTSSDLGDQDFESLFAVGRVRRDFGTSFASFLVSGREVEGGGFNRVLGPDFRWQPTEQDIVTGQFLHSWTETPDRPDLGVAEWDGRELEGHATFAEWSRDTPTWDYFLNARDFDDGFRADNGFEPRVGFHAGYGEVGYTFYPEDKPVSRLRLSTFAEYIGEGDGGVILRGITGAVGLDAILNSFFRTEFAFEDVLGIEQVFSRRQVRPFLELQPGGVFSYFSFDGTFGDEVDFANDRLGDGTTLNLQATLRPTDHFELAANAGRRWLDVDPEDRPGGRLFTADVARLKAAYIFNARSWLRAIGQWVETERDPTLYLSEVSARTAGLAGSLVFAYKLNWQTVAYLGYGDNEVYEPTTDALEPSDRQLFLKISYAFQG